MKTETINPSPELTPESKKWIDNQFEKMFGFKPSEISMCSIPGKKAGTARIRAHAEVLKAAIRCCFAYNKTQTPESSAYLKTLTEELKNLAGEECVEKTLADAKLVHIQCSDTQDLIDDLQKNPEDSELIKKELSYRGLRV